MGRQAQLSSACNTATSSAVCCKRLSCFELRTPDAAGGQYGRLQSAAAVLQLTCLTCLNLSKLASAAAAFRASDCIHWWSPQKADVALGLSQEHA